MLSRTARRSPLDRLTARLTPARSAVLLAVVLGAWRALALPVAYDRGDSGRYLLAVIRAADPALLADDPLVEGLGRFRSLFYDGLGALFHLLGWGPEQLPAVIGVLYVLAGMAGLLALLAVMHAVAPRNWLAGLLIAAWAVFPQTAPLGGAPLFLPIFTHQEIALVVLLAALALLLRGRLTAAWAVAACAVGLHAIFAVHWALAAALPTLWWSWRARQLRAAAPGLSLFGAAALLYKFTLAPPDFSPAEAALFLQTKGAIPHVSLLRAGWRDWVTLGLQLGLAGLAVWRMPGAPVAPRRVWQLAAAGTVLGCVASAAALASGWPLLAQLQPMRVFFWVTLLTHLAIAAAAADGLARRRPIGWLLLAYLAFSMLDLNWELLAAALGVAVLALDRADAEVRAALVAVLAAAVGAGLLRLGGNNWSAVWLGPVALVLLMGAAAPWMPRLSAALGRRPAALPVLLLLILMLAGAQQWRRYFAPRVDPNWDVVRVWVRGQTPVAARFLVTDGENFSAMAWRRAVSRDYSALAWVAPLVYQEYAGMFREIGAARTADGWDLAQLEALAARWELDYIVVDGAYRGGGEPLFRAGRYTVFAADG